MKLFRVSLLASTYFCCLGPLLLIAALIWTTWIEGWLYVCSDSIPILSFFFPPFAHSVNGVFIAGDHYNVAPNLVYTLWLAFLAVPAFLAGFATVLSFWFSQIYTSLR